jgi:hypothetical protein
VPVEVPGGWDLAAAAVWCAAVARAEPDASLEVTLPDPGGARTLRVNIEYGAVRPAALDGTPDGPAPGTAVLLSGAGAADAARHLMYHHRSD